MAEPRRRPPPLPTPARLEKAATAGREIVLPAENSAPGLIDAIGRHYPNSPPGPKPKPPAPRFRTQAAAESYAEHQAALVAQPKPAKPKALKLETAADVTEAMRDVVRQVAAGEIPAIEGVRRTRSLQALFDALGASRFQERLDRIERVLMNNRRIR